jgi:hypothetical protein|tara:strand:- start:1274 stop:1681 length:408 start_codon:yes stop_codon:yes gene_type:complete
MTRVIGRPFKKGQTPWNKGKIGAQSFDYMRGENHYNWKGDKASYRTKHNWVYKNLGRPVQCENCGKESLGEYQVEWANISGRYLRTKSDWMQLCVSCHRRRDMKPEHNLQRSKTCKIKWRNQFGESDFYRQYVKK